MFLVYKVSNAGVSEAFVIAVSIEACFVLTAALCVAIELGTASSVSAFLTTYQSVSPSIAFASTLIAGKILFKKDFLQFFFKSAFQLNELGWDKLNYRWASFFIFLALLNSYQLPEDHRSQLLSVRH